MAAASGEGLEKLEDMIVRAAETTAAHLRAARDAIGSVIFGQERVVDRALITVLSGGHALLVGVPGLAKTKLVETMGIVLGLDARRIQFTPDLMPSDILGTEVLEESPGGQRNFRFIPGPVFAQLLDGRRDQPREPAHPVGAAAGHAGAACHGCRRPPRPAQAVPRAGDPESARAGRHLSAARGAARPLPDASRRRLSRPRGGAAHPVRHHRRRGDAAEAGHDGRRPDRRAAPGAAPAGRRVGGRGDPRPRALGASGAGGRRRRQG